jgi:hypothetical protein
VDREEALVAPPTIGARIVAPHFVCGIELDPSSARVVDAAPIVRYMVGWSAKRVASYCTRRGWEIARLRQNPLR